MVDNDGLHATQERSGSIDLVAGNHSIVVTFFERYGAEVLEVLYQGPGLSKQVIPDTVLFHLADAPPDPVNTPPSVTDPGDQSSELDSSVSLPITASDTDGDSLSFSASGLPPGLSIATATGLISGTVDTVGGVLRHPFSE